MESTRLKIPTRPHHEAGRGLAITHEEAATFEHIRLDRHMLCCIHGTQIWPLCRSRGPMVRADTFIYIGRLSLRSREPKSFYSTVGSLAYMVSDSASDPF